MKSLKKAQVKSFAKPDTLKESGFTLFETLIALTLLGILVAIAWATFERLIAWCRLNIATFELSQNWKVTRLDATGSGSRPLSLCMTEAFAVLMAVGISASIGTAIADSLYLLGGHCPPYSFASKPL